uniref:DUF2218 domain-containing protein n=1 Tax=Caulobacter sp. (strain K31) TaxID=366602 RepID=B0T6H1_CAUSK
MNAATYVATAKAPTSNGSKYLQQLCKHWSHSLAVTFTAEHGSIVFPKDARGSAFPGDGLAILDTRAGQLIVQIEATTPEQAPRGDPFARGLTWRLDHRRPRRLHRG